MKQFAQIAAVVVTLALAGCTTEQINTAKGAAADAIDAACTNLPNMDAQFQQFAPTANAGAKATYASAKAALQSICDNRPLDKPELQAAAVASAVAKIAAVLAPYIADQAAKAGS